MSDPSGAGSGAGGASPMRPKSAPNPELLPGMSADCAESQLKFNFTPRR